MARFISPVAYGTHGITITGRGFSTNDEALITALRKSPDLGRWFFEVMDEAEMKAAKIAEAKKVLASEGIAVEPISKGNIEEDEKDVAEQTRIKKEQKDAEDELIAIKREKREIADKRHTKRAKK